MTNAYVQPRHETRTNDRIILHTRNPGSLLETAEGDFIIGADEDVLLANTREALGQRLLNFMKTRKGSVPMLGKFGSRVHELYGQNSDSLRVLDSARIALLSDLLVSGFSPVDSGTEVLPYAPGIIIINVTIRDNFPSSESAGQKIEQTYQLQSDTQVIEFLGARTY